LSEYAGIVRFLLAIGLVVAPLAGARLSELAEQVTKAGLDASTCYRVRDLAFTRGDELRFYFNDGFLIFGNPVAGRRFSAVFVGDVEGGDGELIVMPPTKGERLSLASFTGSPNLNEHFRQAVMLYADDTAEKLLELVKARDEWGANAERGALLAREWQPTLSNITRSFTVRLAYYLGQNIPPERGFFYTVVQGKQLGNFDVYYEPDAANQIFLGALASRNNRAYYNTWTMFEARPFRTGARKTPGQAYRLTNYRIEAVLEENLHLRVVTRATLEVGEEPLRVVALELSDGMKIDVARLNGEEVEVFAPESLRANLMRNSGSVTFLLDAPQGLTPGRAYELEIEHQGDVVRDAGSGVYAVGSRLNWYPRAGVGFSRFDITFTYPSRLQLVFPGTVKEDTTDGAQRKTRRVTAEPIRLAGFNLGTYESFKVERDGLSVEVFANRSVEPGLARQRQIVVTPGAPAPLPRRQPARPELLVVPLPPPNPTLRLESIANDVAGAFEFLTSQLGPPALPQLLVSPIPGAFGQGFSGLVYLSTLSYLTSEERPTGRDSQHEVFFSELLHAHETAHQWWGNVVASASIHDDWLMEALANYSSLLLYEKKRGKTAMREVLARYREQLLEKDAGGREVDAVGPLRLGPRLQSSLSPGAWHTIVYGKGSWVIHMLRARLGDEKFLAMLGEVCKRYRHQAIKVSQFQEVAASYLPPGASDPKLDAFFEAWVESTGIPSLTLETAVKVRAPNVEVTLRLNQSGVEDSVSLQVPVEVQLARGRSEVHWLTTGGGEPATKILKLRAAPLKVTLDPEMSILRR
jgi:hypothetical protein